MVRCRSPKSLASIGLLLLWAAPPPALGGTVWLCGLSGDLTRLECVADVDPDTDLAAVPAKPTAQVRGTAFPLDGRGRWTVDLWSPATDPEWVARLAQATICYRSPGCEVIMSLPWLEPGAAPQRRRR